MENHKLRLAIRAVLGGGSLVASLANGQTAPATTAAAAAPAEQLQEVVVTGHVDLIGSGGKAWRGGRKQTPPCG